MLEAILQFQSITITGKFGSRNLGESGDLSGVGTKDVKLRVLAMAEKAVADLGKVHLGQTFERDWGKLDGRT